jgi:hypothetical protein
MTAVQVKSFETEPGRNRVSAGEAGRGRLDRVFRGADLRLGLRRHQIRTLLQGGMRRRDHAKNE